MQIYGYSAVTFGGCIMPGKTTTHTVTVEVSSQQIVGRAGGGNQTVKDFTAVSE